MKANLHKKIQHTFVASSLCLAVFLFPLKSEALTVQEVPHPRQVYSGWVTDMAEILTDSTEAQLNQMIEQLEANSGTELAVVTVPLTAPAASPKEFTTELFNYWGIGKKEQDNGVLFLISVGDRRVEIETGYGIEGILPDAKVGRIIDTQIKPRFKQGDFDGGTLAGTKAIVAILAEATVEDNQYKPTLKIIAGVPWYIFVAAVGLGLTIIGYGSIAIISIKPILIEPVGITLIQGSDDRDRSVCALSYLGSFSLVFTLMLLLLASASGNGATLIPSIIAGLLAGWPISNVVTGTLQENKHRNSRRPFHCSYCQQPLEKLDYSQVSSYLTKPQQVASLLGSVNFEGWQCPNCRQERSSQGIHIRAYIVDSDNFPECPNCQERTVKRIRKTVKQPTQYSFGKLLIIEECQCCNYRHEDVKTLSPLSPPLSRSFNSKWSSSVDGFGSGGFGNGSSGGGSNGSNGGGSFGGGDSGGGGAGGDW